MAEQLAPKGRTLLGGSQKVSKPGIDKRKRFGFPLSLPRVSHGHGLELSSMEVLQGLV